MADKSEKYFDVTGMVLEARPIGEYDRRIVLLTRETGKISAFARSARKPNSPLVAATDLFCFGHYRLFAGRDSYTVTETEVLNYFEFFRTHMEQMLYATYMCDVTSYITHENNDETLLLILLYASLRALEAGKIPAGQIRSIFEIRTVVIEGEFVLPNAASHSPAVMTALARIQSAPLSKLYSFMLDEAAGKELAALAHRYMDHSYGHHFKSLDVLEAMGI